MHRLRHILCAALLLPAAVDGQNAINEPSNVVLQSIPSDRVEASYAIYSSLLPLGETAGPNYPHDLWLVQDETLSVVNRDAPCRVESKGRWDPSMNPHVAVHPPGDRMKDFEEILNDFDLRCHDRTKLSSTGWKTSVPLRLLTPIEQEEFGRRFVSSSAAQKYKGAPALYAFSEAYFNIRHSVALVYATQSCGGLCGEGMWIALVLKNGNWTRLEWLNNGWIT
jgi:hypothetical protein